MSLFDWTEDLPKDWEIKPLRSVASYVVSNVDKVRRENETPVRLCNYADVYYNDFITLDLDFMKATASEIEIEKFGMQVDDVLITKDSESWDDIGVPALVRQTSDDLVCGHHLALIRACPEKIMGIFLFRCLEAKSIRMQLELAANGITRFGIPKSEIGTLRLPVPPLRKQRAIGDHLDRETTRLDALIATKGRILELLEEKRKALITHVITCGLDPMTTAISYKAPVQPDSPFPMKRLKHVVALRKSRVDANEGHGPYIGLENIKPWTGALLQDSTTAVMDRTLSGNAFEPGDVLLGKLRPYLARVWVATFAGRSTTECLIMEPVSVESRFLGYVCLSRKFIETIDASTSGSKMPRADWDLIGNIPVPVPELSRQRVIADYLDHETSNLDALMMRIRKTIITLNERRSSLIMAAVTGQIEMGCVT